MISPENLIPVSVILTERKLQLCKIIQDKLKNEGITKSEEEIVNAVSELKNSNFFTQRELDTQALSATDFNIQQIFNLHPNISSIIYKKLFN